MSCTACETIDQGPLSQRVYRDALVQVVLGRDASGERALWVLPHRHARQADALAATALRAHLYKVARRARAAMLEAGIPFCMESALLENASDDCHPYLRVPEARPGDRTGVHALPGRDRMAVRHLETVG